MKKSPRVVTRVRRTETAGPSEISFTENMVDFDLPSQALRDYRKAAWEAFQATPIPTNQDEAWRRTDLKAA